MTSPDSDSSTPTLPPGTKLTYLAEGAANIIYRLTIPSSTPSSPSSIDSTRLLRLRKTLPSAAPNATAFAYLSRVAFPLFPPHLLIATSLVRLPPSLLAQENTRLLALEASKTRPKKRRGMYLEPGESFGFLVADMSPHTPRQLLVEFKPKWVTQSPSAPADATRCRTCALRLKKGGGRGFCPLDLASGEEARVRRAVALLLPTVRPGGFRCEAARGWEQEREVLQETVVAFLLRSELVPVLVRLQKELDPHGPLATEMGERYLDAMTVRDLTVFLRVDMDERTVEAGVGDLDMKTREGGKEAYWRGTEQGLVEGGWYVGMGDDEEWVCQL